MSDNSLNVQITGDASSLLTALLKAQEDFKKAMAALGSEATRAKSEVEKAFSTLNFKSSAQITTEANGIRAAFQTIRDNANSTAADVAKAAQAMQDKLKALGNEARGTVPHVDALGSSGSGLGGKFAASIAAIVSIGTAIQGIKTIITAGMGFEQLSNQLTAATGSATAGISTYQKLKEITAGLGMSFSDVSKSAIGFISATKGTAMEGQKALDIFKGFSTLGAATGRSTQDMERAFVGLQQIIAKGTISAEEWKGQIGDALPSANAYLQKALGKTQAELMKMMEKGEISASVLTQVAAAMTLDNAAAGAKNAETLQGKLNKLKDTIGELYVKIANSSAMDALKSALDSIQEKIKVMVENGEMQKMAEKIGSAIASMVKAVVYLGETLVNHGKSIAVFIAAFAGISALASVVSIITTISTALTALASFAGFATITSALAGIGTAIVSIGAAIAASPLALLAVGLAAVGGAVYLLKEKFEGATISAEKSKEAVAAFKRELDQLKSVKTDTLLLDNANELSSKLQGVVDAFKQRNEKIIESDKKAAAEYSKVMASRLKDTETTTKGMEQREKELKDKLVKLEEEKVKAESAARKAGDEASKAAATQKLNIAIENLNKEKSATKSAMDEQFKAESEIRKASEDVVKAVATQKIDTITENINKEKAVIKAAEDDKAKYASDRLTKDLEISNKRVAALKEVETKITENAKLSAKIMEDLTREYSLKAIEIIKSGYEKDSKNLTEANEKNTASIKERYEKAIKEGEGWLEKMGVHTQRVAELNKKMNDEIIEADKAASDKKVKIKEEEVAKLKSQLTGYENEYKSHLDRMKALDKEITDLKTSSEDKVYQLKQKGLSAELKAGQDIARAEDLHAQAVAKYAEAAAATGEAKVKASKEGEELLKREQSLLDKIADAYDKSNKGILGTQKYLDDVIAKQQSINDLQVKFKESTLATEAGLAKGLVEPIAKLKSELELATKQAEKMKEVLKFEPTIKEGALQKIADDIKNTFDENRENELKVTANIKEAQADIAKLTKDIDAKPASLSIEIKKESVTKAKEDISSITSKDKPVYIDVVAETKEAKAAIEVLKERTTHTHEPKPDTKEATAAIDKLKEATSSTHTVYITEVKSGGSGTGVQTNAEGGLISGPGTGTSDSILSRLSNGEFVVKAASVAKWGANFFHALNQGQMPSVRAFAIGGLVGNTPTASNSANNDSITLNLNINGKNYPVQSARDTALGIANAFSQISRAA